MRRRNVYGITYGGEQMSKIYDELLGKAAAQIRKGNDALVDVFNEIERDEPDRPARDRAQKRIMERAKAEQQKLHAWFDEELAAKRVELERATFGAVVPSADEELPAGTPTPDAYLKAVDAVASLHGKDLVSTFQRAARYNDRPTMAAAARRAIETGNNNIVQEYAATDERFAQNASDYGAFMQRLNRRGRKIVDGMALTVTKPYHSATETVKVGERVVDKHGTKAALYDDKVVWSSAPAEPKGSQFVSAGREYRASHSGIDIV